MRNLKLLLFGILFFVAGVFVGIGLQEKTPTIESDDVLGVPSAKQKQVSMMIDSGDDLLGFSDIAYQEKDTVWSVLDRTQQAREELSVSAVDFGDLGMLIDEINGHKNGADSKYWQYWVNNEYANISADKYALEAGDVIMWKFTASRFQNF